MARTNTGAAPSKIKESSTQDAPSSSERPDLTARSAGSSDVRVPKKKATFNLRPELHQRLKVAAALRGCEMVEIVEDALVAYLREMEKHNLALLNKLG